MRCSLALVAETPEVESDVKVVEQLNEHFAAVMDALVAQEDAEERLRDADMSVNLKARRATFTFDVEEDGLDAALELARAAMRAAIHAAGGFTPGWERRRQWTVVLDEEIDEQLAPV